MLPPRPLFISLLFMLIACATPTQYSERMALNAGFKVVYFTAPPFQLVAYSRQLTVPTPRLHVYLEGDGLPWVTPTRIATDPTPRQPLALTLMQFDLHPALYLARPCYNATMTPACTAWHWTSGRYSEPVINAMTSALQQVIKQYGVREIAFIGYSGGGVLAWLLAARLPETTHLITIAANLDVAGWAQWHGYTPLIDSLTPATQPLSAVIQQWHFIGSRDTNVPPQLTQQFIARYSPAARVMTIDADHRCCWETVWQRIVREEVF